MFFRYNEFSVWVFQLLLAVGTAAHDQACHLGAKPQAAEKAAVTGVAAGEPAVQTQDAVPVPPAPQANLSLSRWVGCPELLDLPARGIACLHCTQPEAHAQADALVQILLESCTKNVSVNYLVDGSFSSSDELLRRHVEALTSDGRRLTVVFYLANGPSQRRYDGDPLPGFGTSISPAEFRTRIQNDRELREQFASLIRSQLPIFELAVLRGAELRVIPMLEDNLDAQSFLAMSEIVRATLPDTLPYKLGRNPCRGCSAGSDGKIPPGIFEETHNMSRASRVPGGIVTNDGDMLSRDELESARDEAGAAGSVFILWSAARQGLVARGSSFSKGDASERDYVMPDFEERMFLIRFLRGNDGAND